MFSSFKIEIGSYALKLFEIVIKDENQSRHLSLSSLKLL